MALVVFKVEDLQAELQCDASVRHRDGLCVPVHNIVLLLRLLPPDAEKYIGDLIDVPAGVR